MLAPATSGLRPHRCGQGRVPSLLGRPSQPPEPLIFLQQLVERHPLPDREFPGQAIPHDLHDVLHGPHGKTNPPGDALNRLAERGGMENLPIAQRGAELGELRRAEDLEFGLHGKAPGAHNERTCDQCTPGPTGRQGADRAGAMPLKLVRRKAERTLGRSALRASRAGRPGREGGGVSRQAHSPCRRLAGSGWLATSHGYAAQPATEYGKSGFRVGDASHLHP